MLVSGAFSPKEQAGSQDQQQQQQQQPTTQSGTGPGAHMPQPTQLPPPGSPAASAYTRIDAWKQLQKDRQEELRQAQAAREARGRRATRPEVDFSVPGRGRRAARAVGVVPK